MSLGVIEECLALSIEYAKNRLLWEKPIAEFQLIQAKLASMEVARLNVQNLVFRFLEMSAAGKSMTLAEASALKLYSARAASEVAMLSQRYPGSADIETLAGDIALARGDGAGALKSYASAAQVRFPFPLMTKMVAALRLDGREADARKLASDFLAQHPQDGEAAEFLGKLAAHAGDWKRARALFDYARTLRDGGGRPELRHAASARGGDGGDDLPPGAIDREGTHGE